MKIAERKLNDIVLTMNTPYTGDVVVTLSLGSKEVWTEELYADEGNISVILPALRKNCYKCTIDTGKETEVHTINVMLEDLLAQEKEEENFWESNVERVKEAAREVVPDLEPKFTQIQELITEKTSPISELAQALSEVPKMIEDKTDAAYMSLSEALNDTAVSLLNKIELSDTKHQETVASLKEENSKSLSSMKS